jgi:ankyrin repeat protein
MVAAYKRNHAAATALINAGANLNALDNERYDLLTIAAVLADLEMVKLAIAAGADTGLVTSPYDGTALIAAAHLGHVDVVRALIDGKAPLDHVNNLGWTALIEAIVLGDGGRRHIAIVRALIAADANPNLADGNGDTPVALAQQRGFAAIARIVRQAGGRP